MTTNADKYARLLAQRTALLKSILPVCNNILQEIAKGTPRDLEEVQDKYDVAEDKWERIEQLMAEMQSYTAIHPLDVTQEEDYESTREIYVKSKRRASSFFSLIAETAKKATQDAIDQALHDQKKQHESELRDAKENVATTNKSKNWTWKPEHKIRVYKGEIEDYFPWWEEFNAAVHSNPDIPVIMKFNYLKSATADGGIVEQTIRGLHCSADSYKEALELLKKRFERKEAAKTAHITRLLNLPEVHKRHDLHGIRQLHDEAEIHIRSLKSLGVTSDTYSLFLKPMILMKLPQELSVDWFALDNQKAEDRKGTVEDLLAFILADIQGREMNYHLRKNKGANTGTIQQQTKKTELTPTAAQLATQLAQLQKQFQQQSGQKKPVVAQATRQCLFCKEIHFVTQCRVPLAQKIELLTKETRCVRCFATAHPTDKCARARPCSNCSKEHHTALCPEPRKVKKLSAIVTPVAITEESEEDNTDWEEYDKNGHLMTSTILVDGKGGSKSVLCLIDQGSMRTFIRRDIAQQLGFEIVGEEKMVIQAFGAKASKESTIASHLIKFRGSFPGAETIQFDALAQETICGESIYQRSQLASELKRKGYTLADNRVHSSKPEARTVGLLIGADHYWKIIEEGIIISKCGLRAIPSKLGWLISGRPENISKINGSKIIAALIDVKSQDLPREEPTYDISSELSLTQLNPADPQLDLRTFWSLEIMGIQDKGTGKSEEVASFEEFESQIKQMPTKRYQTRIPWNDKLERLETNSEIAFKSTQKLILRFLKNPNKDLFKCYHDIFMGYLERDVIGFPDPKFKGKKTLLQHYPVFKPNSSTTPVRPVLHAAFKRKDGVSLNDCMETGPDYNPELLTVLLCFRLMPVVWIADIEKAFHQVELIPEDAERIRFFWILDMNDPTKIVEFMWKRLPFGLTASPYILRAVIRKHVMKYMDECPEIVRLILNLLYVDDQTAGHPNRELAFDAIKKIQNIFSEAGMNMVKIISNDMTLQREISGETGLDGVMSSLMNQKNETKALGQVWNPSEDVIHFNAAPLIEAAKQIKERPTKRQLLSISSLLFDPMGLLAPVVLIAKLMFQELWKSNIGWDDLVSDDVGLRWDKFIESLEDLDKIKIPRYVQGGDPEESKQLVVFGDASETAYGANVYVVTDNKDGTRTSHLLCAKSRVVPIGDEKQTLPRLELLSSLLAATISDYVVRAAKGHTFRKITCFSDSTSALGQIKGDLNRRDRWVTNRCVSIRELTNPNWWRHCPGVENPADIASRGATPATLANSKLYWEGPEWLKLGEECWPTAPISSVSKTETKNPQEIGVEDAPVVVNVIGTDKREVISALYNLEEMERFSKLNRLVRVTAWVMRAARAFRKLLEKPKDGRDSATKSKLPGMEITVRSSSDCFRELAKEYRDVVGPAVAPKPLEGTTATKEYTKVHIDVLSTDEIIAAEKFCLRQVQLTAFSEEYEALSKGENIYSKSSIRSLNPVWDQKDRLIKVTGRIELSFDDRMVSPPILLPAYHPITKLIILATHERLLHAGIRTTLAEVREEFWIIRGRQQVKKHLSHCVTCRKQTSRHFDESPAMLPLDRIREAEPFEIVGVDYAGPLYVWEDFLQGPEKKKPKKGEPSKGKKKKKLHMRKVYMLLFTCAVTRAVHIELVPDQTAHTFVLALRNLFADRRPSSVIYSDNAKTFYKVNKYLRRLRRNPEVFDFLAQNKVKWKFSANLAPWWGGFWERMVRTTKLHIRKVLGRSYLNFFQLQTLLKEVCNVVNSRPLCASSEADGEPTPLTPNHLIYGHRNTSLPRDPEPIIEEDSSNLSSLLKRELKQRKLLKAFWSVWLKDYISDLSKFAAPGVTRRTPKVGELVLIHEANQKRLMWSVGVVNELIVGKDGRARAAWLKVAGTERINRPIQRLFPVEVQSGLDRTEELAKQRKLREEKSRPKVLAPPVSVPVLDQPVTEEVVPIRPSGPRKSKERESRKRFSPPEDVETPAPVAAARSRRGRQVKLPAHLRDYVN